VKVLVLKPSSLGDVIHALPVLRRLRRHWPEAAVDWWIVRGLMPLLEEDPDIRRLVPFDRKEWGRLANWRRVLRDIAALRRERYDLVLDLQGLARTALVGRLCGARRFVGVRDWREFAPLLQGESVPRPSPRTHAAEWYLEVARHLGISTDGPFDWIPERPAGRHEVERNFPELGHGNWIGFQPGARWENKRWPLDSFGQLARILAARLPDHRIAVFGGPDETALGRSIAGTSPNQVLDLTGRLTLPGMIEGLRLTRLLVTNDTGPMHVAAALGRPVVALFGPTDPERTGPHGQIDHVLRVQGLPCAPCMKDRCRNADPLACLTRISPAQVAEKVLERLRT
jgi:lipopolysaccharide heptosyltransferase I